MANDVYDLPKTWPAADVVLWIRATLDEPDVIAVELSKSATGGLSAEVKKRS